MEGRFFTTAPSGKPSKYLSTGHMQGVVHQENISIDPFPLLPFLSYLILSLLTLLIFTYFTYLPYLIFTSSPGMTVQLSCSVVSDYLWSHGLQHARLPCPSPTPGACSNSCPSWWCHPTILSSVVPFSSCLQSCPASGSSNESVLHIRWPKYWRFSFNISPSNDYSGLISL